MLHTIGDNSEKEQSNSSGRSCVTCKMLTNDTYVAAFDSERHLPFWSVRGAKEVFCRHDLPLRAIRRLPFWSQKSV